MYKHAALSPAIQALEQSPSDDAQKQIFEQHISEMAYKTFGAQFPDLVEKIITFRLLDSDVEKGTAFGAFILDLAGDTAYAPVVAVDSALNKIEILYVKSKDMFVPFTPEWIEESQRNVNQALGEASKLPDTVPTDVDIRNLVVPPTTGRYSYASVSEATKIAAAASEPLARGICKRAEEQFDPETWSSFVEQFSRLNGVTPGVALDQGQMDLGILTKMYKSHVKTWQMPQEAQQQAAQQQIQAQAQAQQAGGQQPQQDPNAQAQPAGGQQPQGAPTKTANVPSPTPGVFSRAGSLFDTAIDRGLEGGAVGGAVGGLTGLYDDDTSDIGGRMMRGAAGGALGNVVGSAFGSGFGSRHPNILPRDTGAELGSFIGTLGGSLGAARPDGFSLRRGGGGGQQYYQDPYASDPYANPAMYRYASAPVDPEVAVQETLHMLKHAAAAPSPRPRKLISYLHNAPNAVKTAFAQVLREQPKVLKFAAQTYGTEVLLGALRARPEARKTAGISTETFPGLRITDSSKGSKSFGPRSGVAFRGVQLRGYYYEDSRPAKNFAVIEQEYHDAHDARESGVYKIWKTDGSQEPALIVQDPMDLLSDDRPTFPKHTDGVTHTERYAPSSYAIHPEPSSTASLTNPRPDVERSHKAQRLVLHKDGKYCLCDEIHGEQVTELSLKGSKIYNTLFSDAKAAPKAGLGVFAYKRGAHYYSTKPVRLSNLTTGDGGVVSGDVENDKGWGEKKRFRIDPRSPMSRPMRPRGEDFVFLPATWKWIPLTGESESKDYLLTASSVINFGLNRLNAMGTHKVHIVGAGADRASVPGRGQLPKVAALQAIADDYGVSGADAEAMLKVAELEGQCRVLILPRSILPRAKMASTDQAVNDVLQGLQSQLEQLQGQVQVLQSVQQRAQELSGQAQQDPNAMQQTDPAAAQQGQPPQDPNAQQPTPNGQPAAQMPQPSGVQAQAPTPATTQGQPDPNAQPQQPPQGQPQQDPNAQAQQGAPQQDPNAQPQDPNAQAQDPNAQQQPPLPMMASEGPSSSEIAQQINPAYLQQASQLQDADVFDAGALGELQRAAGEAGGSRPAELNEHTKDLSETVDDLGRTLLTMQLRAVDLQEQLGAQGYQQLEDQVRNTFQGLGKLLLDLNQHAAALTNAQAIS